MTTERVPAEPTIALSRPAPTSQIRGRWLRVIQFGWAITALILIALYISALPTAISDMMEFFGFKRRACSVRDSAS